jgi:hypothetical protein
MKYVVVRAKEQRVETVDCRDLNEAKVLAGLKPMEVDHGTVCPGLGIVVYEFGLMEEGHSYFALGRALYAGNAVLYGYDLPTGEDADVDMGKVPEPMFMADAMEVERRIEEGKVQRPYTAVNETVLWVWQAREE